MLAPFGVVSVLLNSTDGKPWTGFESEGSLATVARVEFIPGKGGPECSAWVQSLKSIPLGESLGSQPKSEAWKKSWTAMGPWKEDDLSAIQECEKFPCAVKTNAQEAQLLKVATQNLRMGTFQSVVQARVSRYLETAERKGYLYPENPVDPWTHLENLGFRGSLLRPSKPDLVARKLEFSPGQMRTVRQVLDRRLSISPKQKETSPVQATLWVRDIYSAHYFDSWGEWVRLECNPQTRDVLILQALVIELDLLKKTDLLSRVARGKMRSAVKEGGTKYLEVQGVRLRELAGK